MIHTLGKKTWLWRIEVILLAPFWFLSTQPDKKSWAKFKNGLIKHKCEFDKENPKYEQGFVAGRIHTIKVYPCKHYGCTVVDPDDNSYC